MAPAFEQIVSDILKLELPIRSAGVAGMRAWDHAEDRCAIQLGIRLYRNGWPRHVGGEDIFDQVRFSTLSLNTKPYKPYEP